MVALVFTLLLFSTVACGFRCRVNSCIKCSSAPANCTVTHIDQYSYNYYCQAPSGCTPQNVPTSSLDGYYCNANLFIRNLSSTDFDGDWFGFLPSDTCEEISFLSGVPLRNNCLDITSRVSSLEGTSIFCLCKEDNCQDIINVTIIIDPPDSVSSSTLINGVITSSSSSSSAPSSVHSSVHPSVHSSVHPSVHSSVHSSVHPSIPLYLFSSTTVVDYMPSSLIRATTTSSSTPTSIPPFTTTPSNTPTTDTVSATTIAFGKSRAFDLYITHFNVILLSLVILGVLGFILLVTIALFVVGLFCLYRKHTSRTRQEIPALRPPLSFEMK